MQTSTTGLVQVSSGRPFLAPVCMARVCLWLLFAGLAFLLECHELSDADVWSHLAAGQWMIDHGTVPRQDPFTFGPDSGPWVDVDWGFQLLLTAVHGAAGIPGLILFTAVMTAAAAALALAVRRPDWPFSVAVLCWLPALLLMTWRLGPRPETLSLLFLASFLVVLQRLEERPALVWVLVAIQLLWVNMSSLFILGPVLVLLYLVGLPGDLLARNRTAAVKRDWRQLGAAGLAVLAACFINPYFFRVFPAAFEVLGKIAVPGNFYQHYVKPYFFEFMSLSDVFQLPSPAAGRPTASATDWHVRAECFLVLCLPVSFLFPALWRAYQQDAGIETTAKERGTRPAATVGSAFWISWLVVALALLAGGTLALTAPPVYLRTIAGSLLALGGIGGLKLKAKSASAAILAILGGLTLSAGLVCLHAFLTSQITVAIVALWFTLIPASITLFLILRHGGSLFRVLAGAGFAYLGWQSFRNSALFALVAGVMLSWNLAEWLAQMDGENRQARGQKKGARPDEGSPRASPLTFRLFRRGLPAALALGLGVWGFTIVTDPFFGLREQPGLAHDAVRFAGQAGLPPHAIVYDLRQAGLYCFHNDAGHQTLMDGRLSPDRRRNFIAYVDINAWLNKNDQRWKIAVEDLGNPSLVVSHRGNHGAEAALLARADWRLVYYDAIASVFVPGGDSDRQNTYPTIDFAARRYRLRIAPPAPVRALGEMNALHGLAAAVRDIPGSAWKWRIPLLLTALDQAPSALDEHAVVAWTVLGNCYWDMITDLKAVPPRPREDWDPARGVPWAQATYCFRQALRLKADDIAALTLLAASFDQRGMNDAKDATVRTLAGQPALAAVNPENLAQVSPDDLFAALSELLKRSLPDACVDLFEKAARQGAVQPSWKLAERIAPVYLHLGRPAEARQLWETSAAPNEARRLCRLAETYWIEREFETALELYQKAAAQDPKLGEARWGLAMLLNQLGRLGPSREACRQGLNLQLTAPQREDLLGLQDMLKRCDVE
jgi:tetratricopeptide (TPR) repeat protein